MTRHKIIVCKYRVENVLARTRAKAIEKLFKSLESNESIIAEMAEETDQLLKALESGRKKENG